MTEEEIKLILNKQKEYFKTGITLSYQTRINNLNKLYNTIIKYEKEIYSALKEDLGKSEYESYMCEVGLTLSEISFMKKHLHKFMKKKTVKTPLSQFRSKSYKIAIPYGNVLIMSPWNYPFMLTMDPLVDAIASGNTVILKPSAYSNKTSFIIKKIIEDAFKEEYVSVITGGRQENQALLLQKFDMIFFTGSQAVGKEVLKSASYNLTPVILELGGKSPCIIDKSANLKLAAKRIVFGKFLNCGQTCVAPDYLLIENSVKEEFIKYFKEEIEKQYSSNPLSNSDYGHIINEKHFDRLLSLVQSDKVIVGGTSNRETLQIEPTVLDSVSIEDPVMQEEIFGPIMPILTFSNFDDVIKQLKDKEKPLALYLFTSNKKHIKKVNEQLSYGGGCINDCVIHLATSEMGFGGVGESGMGSYHGYDGFIAFSHFKSIVDKKTWIDLPMRYQPYKSNFYKNLLKKFLH